ncbi:PqqD family protein [Clostridium sp. 'deep sea']|uniref:PqqD family protein n=1 Tax=Clostridium sp. 'deep sea' TaxID=2779445 RepID=UPI0018969E41|nr:PqqD family protein [Clostridium sp. 'deep sea']QOR34618.1 PqqD family protein [Clostridium sp. 'deep sea']
MDISLSDKFKWILKESGGYIYSFEDKSVKVINETGVYILQNITNCSMEELADNMTERYKDTKREDLYRDINSFINQLQSEGYLCVNK